MSRRYYNRPRPPEPIGPDVLGAYLVPHGLAEEAHLAGTARWRLTSDIAKLELHDAEFLPAASYAEARVALEARFPSPVPGLTRVEAVEGDRDLLVHDTAFVGPEAVRHPNNPRWTMTHEEILVQMLDWAAVADVAVTAKTAEQLRDTAGWDDSDLVIREAGDYALIRFRPSRAQARRTRARNDRAKAVKEYETARAACDLADAVDKAAAALRGALEAEYPDVASALTALSGRHFRDLDSMANASPQASRLVALAALYDRLAGKGKSGRSAAVRALADRWKASGPEARNRIGLPLHAVKWLDAEAARKVRAARKAAVAAATS